MKNENLMEMSMGERIWALRKRTGYSQKKFADKLGMTENTLRKIEKDLRAPNADDLKKIYELTDVTYDELFGRENIFDGRLKREISRLTPVQKNALAEFLKTLY